MHATHTRAYTRSVFEIENPRLLRPNTGIADATYISMSPCCDTCSLPPPVTRVYIKDIDYIHPLWTYRLAWDDILTADNVTYDVSTNNATADGYIYCPKDREAIFTSMWNIHGAIGLIITTFRQH
jgi:hypothetical protein